MNRIKISPLAMTATQEKHSDDPSGRGQAFLPAVQGGVDRNHDASVFVPMHYEKNYAYPLVVWMHSAGQSASEVHDVMPRISRRNYVAVSPEMKSQHAIFADEIANEGHCVMATREAVVAAIDVAKEQFNINPHRIFIAGFGSGATTAFSVALEFPELFAGVLAMNGPLPTDNAPLSQWERSRKLPVFWAHCRRSEQFEQPELCRQLRLLHIAGFSLTLRQYPGGDCISNALLADANRWIMESVTTKPSNHPPHAK